jgi:hypothetical protein
MKQTFEAFCKCCEAAGKPSRVTVSVDGDQVSATCETHGAWPWLDPTNRAAILAHARELDAATP